ncbi:MAG: type II secretion system F family protein [Planctomycetota bacterium]
MAVWRYKAIRIGAGGAAAPGEISATSAAEARAALRRIGLQPTNLRQVREQAATDGGAAGGLRRLARRQLRARRGGRKAELYDSLATMTESGVPLLGALGVLRDSARDRAMRAVLASIEERLRGGDTIASAASSQPGWFDEAEAAMLDSGEQSGRLAEVMRSLAARQARSGELMQRLAAALTYPLIVLLVGLGVTVFLSVKTLPELSSILVEAGIEIPPLTAGVMAFGRFVLAVAPWIPAAIAIVGGGALVAGRVARSNGLRVGALVVRLTPPVLRRAAVAEACLGLAELLRTALPLTRALRVLGPTVTGLGTAPLRSRLSEAADRIDRGEALSDVLDDERFFDAELRQLVRVGETSGELADVLGKIGERMARSARRHIDRLAGLLEPAAIIVLAVGVGTVVMAAVLPLLRLQEILR